MEINKKTFRELCIGDKIYLLVLDKDLPSILELRIEGLSIDDAASLLIKPDLCDSFKVMATNSYIYDNYFIYKDDCTLKLEKICIERIVKLSKIIGKT